jgi:hypothetical protein
MSNGTTQQPLSTANTGDTTGKQIGTESALSNYVGPYVTEMLGKGQAIAGMPYETYTGPLTAGESDLQTKAFTGLAGLTVPTDEMGTFTPGSFTDAGTTDKYMNPYLTAALQPQIDEANRQAELKRIQDAGRLTKAGAFGGSRQAIMESTGNRNLLDNIAKITGAGYRDAYDKAVNQFNVEQNMAAKAQDAINQYGLGTLLKMADVGAAERGIESEGIAEDRAQFEEERDYPYKAIQFMQSLLQGLPLATQSYQYQQPSDLTKLLNTGGGFMEFYNTLFPDSDVSDLLDIFGTDEVSTVGDDDTFINSEDYVPDTDTGTDTTDDYIVG